jgi:hypothetical protein
MTFMDLKDDPLIKYLTKETRNTVKPIEKYTKKM